jgi:methionyl-tRNA synthetase
VFVRQKQHGKEINMVMTTDTHGKRKEHGAHLERHTAKNYTRQRNNSEHGETKTHGKEVDTWPA